MLDVLVVVTVDDGIVAVDVDVGADVGADVDPVVVDVNGVVDVVVDSVVDDIVDGIVVVDADVSADVGAVVNAVVNVVVIGVVDVVVDTVVDVGQTNLSPSYTMKTGQWIPFLSSHLTKQLSASKQYKRNFEHEPIDKHSILQILLTLQ